MKEQKLSYVPGQYGPFEKKPGYLVCFDPAEPLVHPPAPIVFEPHRAAANITVPHGVDRDLVAVLPALWYCLHLPSSLHEFADISYAALRRRRALHLDHSLVLAPVDAVADEYLRGWLAHVHPALVICPDSAYDEVLDRAARLGFPLPPTRYSELGDENLQIHWGEMRNRLLPGSPDLPTRLTLTNRLDHGPTELPRRWLARQLALDCSEVSNPSDEGVWKALEEQVHLDVFADLDESGLTPDDIDPSRSLETAYKNLLIPISLSAPGVPSAYYRRAYHPELLPSIVPIPALDERDTWAASMGDRSDDLIERAFIEFITCHRAIARGSIGISRPSLPQAAFTCLAELERHLEERSPTGRTVWQMLGRLDRAAQGIWSEATVAALRRASEITAFSNFPLGLLRLPEDSSPLCCRVPISYRPLLPLTRAVQLELADQPPVDITGGFKVLVAECIPPQDPVGVLSRAGWSFVKRRMKESGSPLMTISTVEVNSVGDLRAAIDAEGPDILVLSAHGSFSWKSNIAGLVIGEEVCPGVGLEPLPPLVILSACSVAPRGIAAVSVTDLLLREGAVAVLGPQVPVDVIRNSQLMMRLFVYMSEVLSRKEKHSSLLEIWHRV